VSDAFEEAGVIVDEAPHIVSMAVRDRAVMPNAVERLSGATATTRACPQRTCGC